MKKKRKKESSIKTLGHYFRTLAQATGTSRITGFIRDALNASIFGSGIFSDAYFTAFRIPNLFRDFLGEGSLNSAFLPTLSKSLREKGNEDAIELLNQVFSLLLVLVLIIVILGIIFAPLIVQVLARGFMLNPKKYQLTIALTRILFPIILFVSFAALWMSFLNAHYDFKVSAYAPVMMNLVLIGTGVCFWIFLKKNIQSGNVNLIFIWSMATVAGLLLQWIIQVPQVRKYGVKIKFSWPPKHPGVFKMIQMMIPAVISSSIFQINFIINQFFASYLKNGYVSDLYYANRWMQLPLGVFGVSIAQVVFPLLAHQAAANATVATSDTLTDAVESSIAIMLPSIAGLWIMSYPVCNLAFHHGQFNQQATLYVAEATCLYASGLLFYTMIKLLVPAYYSFHFTRWPLYASISSVSVNLIINLLAFLYISNEHTKFLILALSTALGALANVIFLIIGLKKINLKIKWTKIKLEIFKITFATVVMAFLAWEALRICNQYHGWGNSIVSVFIPIAVGSGVYYSLLKILHVESLSWIFRTPKKKF